MNKKPLVTVLCLLALAAPLSSSLAADHSHHHHGAATPTLQLNQGQKWATDAPLRDGMNLVAKEYVACRVDGGGVLLLSEFTGAAKELRAGLVPGRAPLLWGLVSLVAMTFATPLSALSDRLGRLRLITAGWLIYCVFYFLLGLNGIDGFWIWPLFAGYGLFMAATEGVEKALVADLAPAGRQGTAFGWFNLTAGVCLLPASLVYVQQQRHLSDERVLRGLDAPGRAAYSRALVACAVRGFAAQA